jgi:hypothetical protein
MPTPTLARLLRVGRPPALGPTALVTLLTAGLTVLVVTTRGGTDAVAQSHQSPGEVRAERVTVVGSDGTPRIALGDATVAGLSGTGLLVLDRDGRTPRLAHGVTDQGEAGLVLLGRDGTPRLAVNTGFAGHADGVGITGSDAQGTPRFELFFDPADQGGAAILGLFDEGGRLRAMLGSFPDGGTGLVLRDEAGRLRARVGIPPAGAAEVVLFDEAGTVVWPAP